jgi:hypothetical protein
MSFEEYLSNAWSIHAENPKKVAEEFKANFSLMQTEDDVMSMARLIVHVCGGHLGEWQKGSDLLLKLKNNATIKDRSLMNRYVAILNLGNNPNISIDNFSISDQVQIYSSTASALISLGGMKNGAKFLDKAASLVIELTKEDAAYKAVAIAGNSIACDLEDKTNRTQSDIDLMIAASKIGRKFWEIAGTWIEIERAEYRLSQTYFQANEFENSLLHAMKCVEIVTNNGALPLEKVFAYEAVMMANKALGQHELAEKAKSEMEKYFEELPSEDKVWCKKSLSKHY